MAAASCGVFVEKGRNLHVNRVNIENKGYIHYKRRNISKNDPCYCGKRTLFRRNSRSIETVMRIFVFLWILSSLTLCKGYSIYDLYDSPDTGRWRVDDDPPDRSNGYDYNEKSELKVCLQGEFLKGYTLEGGTKAGNYTNLGTVQAFDECAELCCLSKTCETAIMLTYPKTGRRNCFQVDCYEQYSCKPKADTRSKYRPHLFRRGINLHPHAKVATSEETSHSIINNETILDKDLPSLKRDKRVKSMCHEYTGSVCTGYIDRTKLYFYTASNDSSLDQRLQGPISQISTRLSGSCRNIALQAICYRFYPQCTNPSKPKPIQVCNDECDNLTYGKCSADFAEANMLTYLQHVIPDCRSSDFKRSIDGSKNDCISLRDELPSLISTKAPTVLSFAPPTVASSDGLNTASPLLGMNNGTIGLPTQQTPQLNYTTLNTSNNLVVPSKSVGMVELTSLENNSTDALLNSTVPEITKDEKPEIVNVKDNQENKELGLEELDASPGTAPLSSHLPTPTIAPAEEIRVSAGENTEIILPENEVSLYASTWPKEKDDGEYTYEWSQIGAPKNGHGYIEGKTSKNVKLTKLDVPGVYNFALHVHSISGKSGVGHVNITVKEPTHVNHPPRAEIFPKEQTISLPTNTVVLDGTKSTDDDEIVSYKWEELKGPIKQNTVFGSGTGSKILQLQNLVAGEYTLKLTVTDSNGETDMTEAIVTVKEELDYPPEANAGNDVIIHLPNNSVILNGNKSTDDKGRLEYAWSKTAKSPTCDMQGTDKPQLRISSLTKGTYVFILKVTDTGGHESEARVKVIVLAEVNTKPVAIAGDDKELKYPDTSTTLDGSASTDNSKIVSYLWEKISGPDSINMVGVKNVKVHISDLKVGTYVIRLTVSDDKQLTGTDTVQIKVKRDHNEPPTAVIKKPQRTVYLPIRSTQLDGSKSTDDEMIKTYHWTRAGSSPAAGDIINGSDHKPFLLLTNLVKGRYIFDLTVIDEKGLSGTASAVVNVKEDPNKLALVEMYIDVDIARFSEESKKQLIRKVSVILEVDRKFVKIVEITSIHYRKGVMVLFYVDDPNIDDHKYDGLYIAGLLKHKVGNGGKLFGLKMLRVEPYICRNNCSGHGYCDESTKECICDTFWMGNFFKSHIGSKESNCDWSILYLSVVIFAIFLLFLATTWGICFLLARKKRSKRRARYRALRSTDPDGADDEILLIPKAMKEKFAANSLTFTESDEDSEEETTVFDKKRVNGHARLNGTANGHARLNGSINGKTKYRDHAM